MSEISTVQARLHELRFNSCFISLETVFSMAAEDTLAVAADLTMRRQSAAAMDSPFPDEFLTKVLDMLQEQGSAVGNDRPHELRYVVNHAVFSGLRPWEWQDNFPALKNGPNM